jgi:hypothetical protein
MCMAVSFVDRDMIMRYFGGGVGHLKNTPSQQAHRSDPVDPDSEEMEVEDEEGDTGGNTRGDPQDIIMSDGELEVGEDDEEKGQDDNDDETDDDDDDDDEDDESDDEDEDDEDEEFARGGDENEDEDYGYGSP